MSDLLMFLQHKAPKQSDQDWRIAAHDMVVDFDDGMPCMARMCGHYIKQCHAEFKDVPYQIFANFMAHRLQSYRRNN